VNLDLLEKSDLLPNKRVTQKVPIFMTYALQKIIAQAKKNLPERELVDLTSEIITRIRSFQFQFKSFPEDPIERAKTLQALVDEEIKKKESKKSKISCKAGCSSCCHPKVVITEDEVKLLKSLGVPYDENQLKGQLPLEVGKRYPVEKTKCVFLSKAGRCKVYEHRPMSCRKYFVVSDPKDCLTSKPHQVQILSYNAVELIVSAAFDYYKTYESFAEGFLNESI